LLSANPNLVQTTNKKGEYTCFVGQQFVNWEFQWEDAWDY